MADQVELFVHPLCPFAQRALYAKAYRGLDIKVTEVDTAIKPDFFLAVNPQGKVPAAKVITAEGRQVNLFESLTVAHYIDSLPGGRSLFPADADGHVTPLTRAACDAQAQYVAGKLMELYNFYRPDVTEATVQGFKKTLREVNALLSEGFIMNKHLGTSQITFADIMNLSLIERIVAHKEEALLDVWAGEDFGAIQGFYDTIFQESWAQEVKANPAYLNLIVRLIKAGKFRGLKLPITRYESEEAYEA
mmetsp:Transcript_7935/g.15429  ORF Transcript_7935/g.15429 Transcript_7935/m.15429 type:complete len:248 (+) Transcript_7935:2827-3570(+)